jgi:hypothetical protein
MTRSLTGLRRRGGGNSCLETARQSLNAIAKAHPGTPEATAATQAKQGLDSWSNDVAAGKVPGAVLEGNMSGRTPSSTAQAVAGAD